MPDFRPFRGIRYDTERFGPDLTPVAAPPYDVIDPERRARLGELDEHNAVHLTLPADVEPGDRYERAAELLARWIDERVLVADPQPRFYRYRSELVGDDGRVRTTTGVVGALELLRPGDGDVLPHERTMPKPKGDRLELLRTTRANLEPIWGLSLAPGLTELLDEAEAPVAVVTDTRGARHELRPIVAPAAVESIAEAVAAAPVVLADGHHRYETSLHYRNERHEAGDGPGEHDRIMALVVELSADELAVQPIHRVIRHLEGGGPVRTVVEPWFEVVDVGPNEPDVVADVEARMLEAECPALVDGEGVALLLPRSDVLDPVLADEPEPLRTVDTARFEAAVAPGLEDRGAEVEYRHSAAAVADLVRKGDAVAAVLLRPVDVPTIQAVAQRRALMPQKTTFFHPKPSTGLVFRSLDVT